MVENVENHAASLFYLKKRFDFSVKSPPLPVPEFEVRGTVPLQDSDSVQLLNFLLIVPEHQRNL